MTEPTRNRTSKHTVETDEANEPLVDAAPRSTRHDTGELKWHYTTGQGFKGIVAEGVIRPATAFVAVGERPIVWFSTRPDWEPTANKMMVKRNRLVRLTREETEIRGGGLVRIGVAPETAPHDWRALQRLSGMSKRIAERLDRVANQQGANPAEWWGTFDPVPRSAWAAVHVYQESRWVDVPFEPEPVPDAA